MEMDEYARAQSTRLGLQALLTALMQDPYTSHLATEAKALALQMAAEADRHMPKGVVFEQQSEQVYAQLEDLFRPVTALQNHSRSK